ncbi:MAG: cytochrome-c peroxidase, partial [Bacteriovoracales bacterium]
MKPSIILICAFLFSLQVRAADKKEKVEDDNLGLPKLEIPENNPITKEKVELGHLLFNDLRFSTTGTVSCATCHDQEKTFTDSPLRVSKGINDLTGTRNSPTVINAAYFKTQFWDGRSPDLEDQALHPFLNPVEMGLKDHNPILEIVRNPDEEYSKTFKKVFGVTGKKITMKHVTMAIAAFERTVIGGNSRFDRWYFKGEPVLSKKEIKGYETYIGNGRCVSCHVIEHTTALFTDNKFHNIGVGINRVPIADVERISKEFFQAKYDKKEVDLKVLQDPKTSETGRFAVNRNFDDMGSFKTSSLRNIALTAPYM